MVGSVIVALASLVTSVVPPSSWVASFPITSDLRASLPGRMIGLTFMMAGLGLMAWAWLSVGRQVMAGLRPPLLRMASYWSAPLLLMPPLFSRDAWSYAAQGALVAEGFNPYDAVGIALLAVVLLGPTAHDWYFLWCLPFLAVARPGRRLTTTMTAVSLILTIAAPLNSSLRGATIPILTTTALAIATIAPLLNHLRTLQPHLIGRGRSASTPGTRVIRAPSNGEIRPATIYSEEQ